MIIQEEDKDIIRIDLSEVFGKVIRFSASDSERVLPEHGDLILVMREQDSPIFLTHIDVVVMDLTGRLADVLSEDSIEIEDYDLNVNIKKDALTGEGLKISREAIQQALSTGVLAEYQLGAPGYEHVQQANRQKYMHALNTLAAAVSFRMDSNKRRTIERRDFL